MSGGMIKSLAHAALVLYTGPIDACTVALLFLWEGLGAGDEYFGEEASLTVLGVKENLSVYFASVY